MSCIHCIAVAIAVVGKTTTGRHIPQIRHAHWRSMVMMVWSDHRRTRHGVQDTFKPTLASAAGHGSGSILVDQCWCYRTVPNKRQHYEGGSKNDKASRINYSDSFTPQSCRQRGSKRSSVRRSTQILFTESKRAKLSMADKILHKIHTDTKMVSTTK